MILRRLAGAIRRQDWFVVLTEFMIVVTGIIVAIQLDNWNEARHKAERAVEYRSRLAEDLRYDLTVMKRRSNYFEGVMEFALEAEAALSNEDPVLGESPWEVALASYQAGQAWPFAIFGATYRELQSAGELDLIGGAEPMTLLSEYYDNGAFQYAYVAPPPPYRDMIRGRLPYTLVRYIAASCEVSLTTDTQELRPCEEPEDTQDLAAIVADLKRDRMLLSALRTRMSQLRVQREILGELSEEAQKLIEHLDAP
jgi:hypothetical protein